MPGAKAEGTDMKVGQLCSAVQSGLDDGCRTRLTLRFASTAALLPGWSWANKASCPKYSLCSTRGNDAGSGS